ncbi:hypothetical protein LTR66_015578, partial [Elasticomyces elasticus]
MSQAVMMTFTRYVPAMIIWGNTGAPVVAQGTTSDSQYVYMNDATCGLTGPPYGN